MSLKFVMITLFVLAYGCVDQSNTELTQKSNKKKTNSLAHPSDISLISPDSSNSDTNLVELSVSGVESGNLVKLYNDSSCENVISEIIADNSVVTFNLELQDFGAYTFYATQEKSSLRSNCSTANVTYVYEQTIAPTYMGDIQTSSPQQNAGTSSNIDINIIGVTYGHQIGLYSDSSCQTELSTQTAQTDSVSFSVELSSLGDYNFYALSTNNYGSSDCVLVHSYSYGTAPSPPSALEVSHPGSTGSVDTPSILVSGVTSGDIVKLYLDSNCSSEVGSTTSSSTQAIITSSILTEFKVYSFYATTSNSFGSSTCSVASADYELTDGPVAYPTVALNELATKRTSFVNCANLDECSVLNDGSTVDIGSGVLWKLTYKSAAAERWLDSNTNLIWSESRGTLVSWSSGMCNMGTGWRIPSKTEMETALSDSLFNVISLQSQTKVWTSTTGPDYILNAKRYPTKYTAYVSDNSVIARRSDSNSFGVRCVKNAN